MDIFSRIELKLLLAKPRDGDLCLSVFMPTYKTGADVMQNPIRLRNLLREAKEQLVTTGMRSPEAVSLLTPVQELLDDSFFWRTQSDGLVIFLSPELFRYYRLPYQFKEMVVVSHRFHVKPLLPILSNDGRFYILAISQKQVRLLQCTRYGLKEIALNGIVPASLDEFMKYENMDRELQYHQHASMPGLGAESMVAHGREVSEETKANILRFFQHVDRGLRRDILRDEVAPLLLAAVDYLFPIYRQANAYRYLVDGGITGNPDNLTAGALHSQSWSVIEPYFTRARVKALARYVQFAGTERATNDIKQIVMAASRGRVELLFVASGVEQWGAFDPATGAVELHGTAQPYDEDLLDLASASTIVNRGDVFTVEPAKVPGGPPLAALFRY